MAVPVAVGEQEIGLLVVANRQDAAGPFDVDDLRLFEALAAHLGTALTSSRRLDRLRHEVAAREHEALHDSLTGLPNRTLFTQWVSAALRRRRPSERVAVMLMDLDGFKEINDTLGHHTGDAILKETRSTRVEAVGPTRLAARLGGDEFAFVIPAAGSLKEVSRRPRPLLESVSRPIAIDGLVLVMRASVGVAMAPDPRLGPVDAAEAGRRRHVRGQERQSRRHGLRPRDRPLHHPPADRWRASCARPWPPTRLEVWYQPLAHLPSARSAGSRRSCAGAIPSTGLSRPDEFIPVAEHTGLIEPHDLVGAAAVAARAAPVAGGRLRGDHGRQHLGSQPARHRDRGSVAAVCWRTSGCRRGASPWS